MGCSGSQAQAKEDEIAFSRRSAEGEVTSIPGLEQTSHENNVTAGGATATPITVNDFTAKAKRQFRGNGSKPSGPEFIAYARYLGLDPVGHRDLLWIALDALEAPLPADWSEHFDPQDRVYYHNLSTKVSTWTHPLEYLYREAHTTVMNSRSSSLSLQERKGQVQLLQQEVEQLEVFAHREIGQWSEHTDEQGHPFYFNREERRSTWTDPRPALRDTLHLKMKVLRLLQSEAGVTSDTKDNDLSRSAPISDAESDVCCSHSEAGAVEEATAIGNCVICLDASATHVIVPCGHQAFCAECAKKFKNSSCPCCRTTITQIIKVYVPAPRQMPKRQEEPNTPDDISESDIIVHL